MTTKLEQAARQALGALVRAEALYGQPNADIQTAIREALAEQSIVLNDPHPPHRLCECTACLEYWTPLPDCDAFAGGGKPIDHIADTGKMVAEPMKQERYFCERCGKRVGDKNGVWEGIHTCTPPADARDCGGAHHAE